jgi:hypothetical protein
VFGLGAELGVCTLCLATCDLGHGAQIIAPVPYLPQRGIRIMRWATRQHVLTSRARRRSLWHHWFAWYPVVVNVDDELDHWVWFERPERKWSISKYGGRGRWRYRHPMAQSEQSFFDPGVTLSFNLGTFTAISSLLSSLTAKRRRGSSSKIVWHAKSTRCPNNARFPPTALCKIADRQDRHLFVQYEECIWDIGYQMQDDLKEQHQRGR